MNEVAEIAFKILFRIVAQFVVNVALEILLTLSFLFFRRTGDVLIEDAVPTPVPNKPLDPIPDWAAALLGLIFWCALAAAAWLSWPWLASL